MSTSVVGRATGLDRQALRELARTRSAADRLRTRATSAAAAGTAVALLVLAALVGIVDVPRFQTVVTEGPDGSVTSTSYALPTVVSPTDGLISYVAQPGLRLGAEVGALLLVLPFLALAVQALRVGTLARQEREGLLVVAGASPGDLGRIRVASTRAAAVRGALWAAPSYLVLWLLLGLAAPVGARLLPEPQWWLAVVWAVLVGVLAAAGTGAGVLLGRRRAAPRRVPAAGVAWATGAGTALCVGLLVLVPQVSSDTPRDLQQLAFMALLVGALLLLAVCAVAVLARAAVRPAPRRTARAASAGIGAEEVLATAQRRANPVASGASGAVLVLVGLCVGVCVSFATSLSLANRGSSSDVVFYGGGVVLAGGVAAVAAAVALVSLALSLTDHLAQARRAVAATAALGCDVPRLVDAQGRALAATAVPSAVTGTLVGGLLYGGLLAALEVGAAGWVAAAPLGAVLVVAVVVGAGVRLLCGAVAELLGGRVRRAAALENLRTP